MFIDLWLPVSSDIPLSCTPMLYLYCILQVYKDLIVLAGPELNRN